MKVNITQEDYETMGKYFSDECLLARSLKREHPNSNVRAGGETFRIDDTRYDIPLEMQIKVQDMCERSIEFEPFSFEAEVFKSERYFE